MENNDIYFIETNILDNKTNENNELLSIDTIKDLFYKEFDKVADTLSLNLFDDKFKIKNLLGLDEYDNDEIPLSGYIDMFTDEITEDSEYKNSNNKDEYLIEEFKKFEDYKFLDAIYYLELDLYHILIDDATNAIEHNYNINISNETLYEANGNDEFWDYLRDKGFGIFYDLETQMLDHIKQEIEEYETVKDVSTI